MRTDQVWGPHISPLVVERHLGQLTCELFGGTLTPYPAKTRRKHVFKRVSRDTLGVFMSVSFF